MLTRRAPIAALVGLLVIVGMSGCFGGSKGAQPTPSAKSSASPLFASDEEALAAATKAYAAYLKATDAAGQAGWASVSGIEGLVTMEALSDDKNLYQEYATAGWRQSGTSSFDTISIQRRGASSIETYLCLDASRVDVLDSTGVSVVNRDQPRRVPLQVGFAMASDGSNQLLVGRSEVWTGENYC